MSSSLKNISEQLTLHTFLVTLAAVLFLAFLIYPKGREIYFNKLRLEQKRLKLDSARSAVAELPSVSREFLKVKKMAEGEAESLLPENAVGDILLLVDQAVQKSGMVLLSVNPRYELYSDTFSLGRGFSFKLLPVDLKVQGSYSQIIGFIEVLFQQKKMLLLERAIMEKSTLAGRIDSSLTVQFFIRAKDPEPLEISEEEHVGQE